MTDIARSARELEVELTRAREQQAAVASVLRTMSAGPTDLDAILDAILQAATRLCGSDQGFVYVLDGDFYRLRAAVGIDAALVEWTKEHPLTVGDPGKATTRAAISGHTVHIADIFTDGSYRFDEVQRRGNFRALLSVPLVKNGVAVAVITMWRTEPRPFSDDEIALMTTFADQALIAFESVRLATETRESLDRQTAISGILGVMSRSPEDVQPVLDVIAKSARRYCGAEDAMLVVVESDRIAANAHDGDVGWVAATGEVVDRSLPAMRAVLDGETINVPDLQGASGPEWAKAREIGMKYGIRTVVSVPMIQGGRAIGSVTLRRRELKPFTDAEISLLRTFADQAVIAIENVRLFNETKSSLDRQTALATILRAIAASPTDEKPVLDVIAESAVRYSGASDASVLLAREDELVPVAHFGPIPSLGSARPLRLGRDSIAGRALIDRMTIHVADVLGPEGLEFTQAQARQHETGQRAMLAAPLVRGDRAIGAIVLRKTEPVPFPAEQIQLVETFADQAVIAIENVRLFNETKASLERQTATSEVLQVISRSTFDIRPVLEAVLDRAVVLTVSDHGLIVLVDGDGYTFAAYRGSNSDLAAKVGLPQAFRPAPRALDAMNTLRTVQVEDLAQLSPPANTVAALTDARSELIVPLVKDDAAIGVFILERERLQRFDSRQVEVIETFARQATIAIENVRLFNETKESLEQQTAIADILRVISASPTDTQPVLDAIAESATRFAAAEDAAVLLARDGQLTPVAHHGPIPMPLGVPIDRESVSGRATFEVRTVHAADVLTGDEYPRSKQVGVQDGQRTVLAAPLIRAGSALGVIVMRRREAQPFTERQVELAQTFANQAAIALENVRLFNETKKALDRQTAISEVLKTISQTVFDLPTTLGAIVENAGRLAGADLAWVSERVSGEAYFGSGIRWAASAELRARFDGTDQVTADRLGTISAAGSFMGRLHHAGRVIRVDDVETDRELLDRSPVVKLTGSRSLLGVPLRTDEQVIGALVLARVTLRPFEDREVQLAETFANQASIAVQNVRLFNEIQQKSRELEVANRHKSEFLANMSHELRTPLNAIIGFSEVLTQGIFGDINPKQKEYLEDILSSGKHLLTLINDILDLSKIEAGRMELERGTFSLAAAINSGLTIVRERAARHGISLEAVVPSDLPAVEADERKVKQILYNLLSNAVKFTPDGGRVEVRARADDGGIRIDVEDNGIGIAPDDQARIFDEFRQVGRERSREGTGLGLTLTRRFVELHGGRIWVQSTPSKGSTFSFTLPLHRAAPVSA